MPTYIYRAKNLKGEEISGTFTTNSVDAMKEMLGERGYFLLDARKEPRKFELDELFGKVNIKDIAVFCRKFSVILNSGITILEAMEILSEQAEKRSLAKVLTNMHEELQKGKILSKTMEMYPDIFPEFLINMVQVGEASGSLDTVMNRMADYYEKENRIRRKIRTAMTYPTILAVLTVGVIILLLVQVLPMFTGMLKSFGGELPAITLFMMNLSDFFVGNFIAIIIFIILAASLASYYLKTDGGRLMLDGMKLNIPIIRGAAVKVMTSRFARSMGILLKSGIPVINAIDIMSNLIGNRVVQEKFNDCKDEVKEGKGLSEPIKKLEVFPSLLIHMIAVGERTGELDEMLTRSAGFFDEEVEEAIEKLTTLIEPLMLVVMAVIVGTVILAVMLPMANIMDAIH